MSINIHPQWIRMGDGTTLVSTVNASEDGYTGVAFTKNKGEGIGVDVDEVKCLTVDELQPDVLLQFNNPDSIDVVINRLLEAKELLEPPEQTDE